MNTFPRLFHLSVIGLLLAGATASGQEVKRPRFGLYMPKLDVYTQTDDVQARVVAYLRTTKPSEIPLAEQPFVSEEDLLSYEWETHTLHLRHSIWFKVREPGMHGVPFVVVADGVPLYVGAFWSNLSSIPAQVPVVTWDYQRKSKDITIERAYPTPQFAQGEDVRASERLKKLLTELGKLKSSAAEGRR